MQRIKFYLAIIATIVLAACGGRSNDVPVSGDALSCMAEAMYFEARGTGEAGRRAVGEVILNRAAHPEFPSTICGVVDHRYNGSCQFSYRCAGPLTYTEENELSLARATASELLSRRGEDITRGALFFHAASMAPGWFGTLTRLGQFGGNIFYK